MGGTDCARLRSRQSQIPDTFLVSADSETGSGPIHPFQDRKPDRDRTRVAATWMVMGIFSLEPDNAGSLEVVGF